MEKICTLGGGAAGGRTILTTDDDDDDLRMGRSRRGVGPLTPNGKQNASSLERRVVLKGDAMPEHKARLTCASGYVQ